MKFVRHLTDVVFKLAKVLTEGYIHYSRVYEQELNSAIKYKSEQLLTFIKSPKLIFICKKERWIFALILVMTNKGMSLCTLSTITLKCT